MSINQKLNEITSHSAFFISAPLRSFSIFQAHRVRSKFSGSKSGLRRHFFLWEFWVVKLLSWSGNWAKKCARDFRQSPAQSFAYTCETLPLVVVRLPSLLALQGSCLVSSRSGLVYCWKGSFFQCPLNNACLIWWIPPLLVGG